MRRGLTLGLLIAAGCSAKEAPPKPNVVVIVVDTLRPDHLPMYGYTSDTAPFLTSLAHRGAIFTSAWSSSSWTAPATASLFTALYPPQHGIVEGFFIHRTRAARDGAKTEAEATLNLARLPGSAPSLPEHFQRAGWSTWGITANVNVTERLGFDRGFQHFRTLTGVEHGKGGAADLVLKELQQCAREMVAAQPYFLYLHFNDVHAPWGGRAPIFAEGPDLLSTERSAYDSEIRFVDEAIKVCFSALGWEENTLVCVLSDHGEEFEEHGGRGHGLSLYRELLQVAWLLWWPGHVREGTHIGENASLIDVFPTLAELAGAPEPAHIEGRSLAAALAATPARAQPHGRTLFAQRVGTATGQELWAVVQGDWKLIERGSARELYDLRERAERENLAARHPEIVERLSKHLTEFRARARPLANERVDIELDAREVDALRQLGYTK